MIGTAILVVLGAAVAFLLYRAFIFPMLTPLMKLPHPPASRLLGVVPEIIRDETCAPQMRWMQKYGKTFSYMRILSNPTVMTADPAIVKRILVTEAKKYGKTMRQIRIIKRALGEGLVTSVGAKHARSRGLLKTHFQFANLKAIFPVFVKQALKLAAHWDSTYADTGKEMDVIGSMSKFTLDVIGLSAFAYNFNATAQPDGAVTRAVSDMLPSLSFMSVIAFTCPPARPLLKILGIGPFRKRDNAIDTIRGKVREIVAHRIKLLKGHEDEVSENLLDIMIKDKYKDGTKMTPEELEDQTLTFMMAGHETTSNMLTWTWLLLSQHPDIEQRVRAEVLAAFPDGDEEMQASDLAKMPLLWAVCQESLRLYPPVPLTSRQARVDDVWEVDGRKYRIPKGTPVFLSPFCIQRHPDHWENPDEFRPMRWFVDEDMTVKRRPKPFTFLPFLFGDRSCIGQRMAVMEAQASLAVLLRRFTLRRLPNPKPLRRKLAITMRPTPKLIMTVHRVATQQ